MSIQIQRQVSLKSYSTFKIGGEANFFCLVSSKEDVVSALDFAIVNKLNVFVLGGGSNLLISDQGYQGLVVKMINTKESVIESDNGVELGVSSGVSLSALGLSTTRRGYVGMQWAVGIPATIGGAICNNAGAGAGEMSKIVKEVEVIELFFNQQNTHLEGYEIKNLVCSECAFVYRSSLFKKNKNFLILSAKLILHLGDSVALEQEIQKQLLVRKNKQPLEYPNIGSIFCNPVLSDKQFNKVLKKTNLMATDFVANKVPAGLLIEKAGLKGFRVGDAEVSHKHANFIVNLGNATAEEVIILISYIKQKVRQKFSVQLQEEIEYVGFEDFVVQ